MYIHSDCTFVVCTLEKSLYPSFFFVHWTCCTISYVFKKIYIHIIFKVVVKFKMSIVVDWKRLLYCILKDVGTGIE